MKNDMSLMSMGSRDLGFTFCGAVLGGVGGAVIFAGAAIAAEVIELRLRRRETRQRYVANDEDTNSNDSLEMD